MRVASIAFGFGLSFPLALAMTLLALVPAFSQKIIVIKGGSANVIAKPVRVIKFGRVTRGRFIRGKSSTKSGLRRLRFSAFAFPDQTLFPPYYRFPRPYAKGPDMRSRIKGGATSRQGSKWRSHIRGGKTVRQGSSWGSHIKGGPTVEGGSRWASHIVAGRTVEGGSPYASTRPNWRFSGYAAPMRPKGISYFRARRKRSPWASRLR